ncbi:MAG: ATP-binding protein [Chthoniobacterales bacterium]|nr:ATP-binding protein [Chthoniobacterales bacterium]
MKRGFLEKLLEKIQFLQPHEVQNYLAELAHEKGFLETLFDALLEGILVTDNHGKILYINRSAANFFGLDTSSSLGKFVSELIHGLDWNDLHRNGNEVASRDMEVLYPVHRILEFYVVNIPNSRNPDENSARAILLRDVTLSRRSAEEIRESDRISALTQLAAGVAHEIGNPLNSLGIHLQILQRRIRQFPQKFRSQLEDSISIACQEVSRLDAIINQFLRAVRPIPLSLRSSNLNQLLQESLDFLSPEIHDREILLETDFDPTLPNLQLDPDQIKQAIYNILRNSFQAMKNGGFLQIRTWHDEETVSASISDTGGGIPSSEIGRIFEPYFTTKPGGSGLGLMIVRRIIRAHGGEVIIQSSEGHGVTVTIRLPTHSKKVRMLEAGTEPRKLLPSPSPTPHTTP